MVDEGHRAGVGDALADPFQRPFGLQQRPARHMANLHPAVRGVLDAVDPQVGDDAGLRVGLVEGIVVDEADVGLRRHRDGAAGRDDSGGQQLSHRNLRVFFVTLALRAKHGRGRGIKRRFAGVLMPCGQLARRMSEPLDFPEIIPICDLASRTRCECWNIKGLIRK